MSIEAPLQIRRAVFLLWSSLVLSIIDSGLSLPVIVEAEPKFRILFGVALFAIFAVTALLIYLVSRRRNWARIVLLLITIVPLSEYFIWPPDFAADPWWSWALTSTVTVFDIVALVFLFTGRGAQWYSSRPMA